MSNNRKLSDIILNLNRAVCRQGISVQQMLRMFRYQSAEIILFIALIPIAMPLPLPPGIVTILAIPVIVIALQYLVGKQTIWLPMFILNIKINKNIIRNIYKFSNKYLQQIEAHTGNKLKFISAKPAMIYNKIIITTLCILTIIPLPISSMVFAFSACLILAGIIIRDGILILLGWLFGIIAIATLGVVITFLFKIHFSIMNAIQKINTI